MTIRAALKLVRENGFKTQKQNGTWWISKPYHSADMIREINGVLVVGIWQQSKGQRVFVDFEEFKENM